MITDDVLKRALRAAYAGMSDAEFEDGFRSMFEPGAQIMLTTEELRAAIAAVLGEPVTWALNTPETPYRVFSGNPERDNLNREKLIPLYDPRIVKPEPAELVAVADELSEPKAPEPLRVTVEFPSYNERRYGLPWIARVTAWPVGGSPQLEFGKFIGRAGDPGECEILAQRGDIVRWGQKDNRGNHTMSRWGIVGGDGTIDDCTESQARKAFLK